MALECMLLLPTTLLPTTYSSLLLPCDLSYASTKGGQEGARATQVASCQRLHYASVLRRRTGGRARLHAGRGPAHTLLQAYHTHLKHWCSLGLLQMSSYTLCSNMNGTGRQADRGGSRGAMQLGLHKKAGRATGTLSTQQVPAAAGRQHGCAVRSAASLCHPH